MIHSAVLITPPAGIACSTISQRMREHYKSWSALIIHSAVLITSPTGIVCSTPLLVNIFHNKVATNIPNKIRRNSPFCFLNPFSLCC